MNPFITYREAGFTILKSVFISLILSLSLPLSILKAQTFTDGYFNFPAPDCFVEPEAGEFGIELQFLMNGNVPTYSAPLVADLNNDGNTEVIAMSAEWYSNLGTRNILIFNGQTGEVIRTISTPYMNYWGITPIAIADLTGDGYGEIVIATIDDPQNPVADRGVLICYDYEGNELWRSNDGAGNDIRYGVNAPRSFGSAPSIADFNGDGVPEVYLYNEIYNGTTGTLLVHGGFNGIGMMMNHFGYGAIGTTVAADFTDSPGLELAAGNTVYEVEITNFNGTAGNTMTAISAGFNVLGAAALDGFTSTADINLDGRLDVVVASIRQSGAIRSLYVWNPRTNSLIAEADLPNGANARIGTAFIGDVNADGRPNIGICTPNRVHMYEYNGTTTLSNLWTIPSTDGSGLTKITMFDFNQNGRAELVYRDESTLRIIDGSTANPVTLASFPSFSNTAAEGPVIADINGNGSAEVIVTSNNNNSSSGPHVGSLQVFTSSEDAWAPARSVWNQYQYFNVNIRDDLSVPLQQPNHGTEFFTDDSFCPITFQTRPLNNFYVQSTYYDENGCLVIPTPDPSVRIDSVVVDCSLENTVVVYFTLLNRSSDAATSGEMPISFYSGDPLGQGVWLRTVNAGVVIPPDGQSESMAVSLGNAHLIEELFLSVNDDGSNTPPISFPVTAFPDCDFSNNIAFNPLNINFDLHTEREEFTCDENEAGTVVDFFVAASGCDSSHTLITTYIPPDTLWFENFSCTPADTGTAIVVYANQYGCDSLHITTTELAPTHDIYEETWACNPQDTGLVVFQGMNQYGCDSTHTTQYNLASSQEIVEEGGSCNPADTGTVITTYTNRFGCDSIHTVHTELWPSHEFFVEDYSCFPADTGLVVDMHTNSFGCDSVYYLRTHLKESDETFEYYGSCNPADTATIVEEHLNEVGCDSIHYIVTELLPTDTTVELVSTTHPSDTGQVIEYHLNQYGCDSIHITITELVPSVYIPNAFSPNTDGINDEFRAYINVPAQIELMIFDRWGSKVFESRDPGVGWDGLFRGEPAPEGIYTFQLSVQFSNGSSERFSGDLLLIR